jgi:hypothetical protein
VQSHETPSTVRFNPGDPGVGGVWCCDVYNLVQWPNDTGRDIKWAVARALQQVLLPLMYDYCEYRRHSQAHFVEISVWNQLLVQQLQRQIDDLSSRIIEVQARARIVEQSVSVQLGKIYRLQDEVKSLREFGASPMHRSSSPVDIQEAVRRAQAAAYCIRGGPSVPVVYSGCNTPMSLISGCPIYSGSSTPVSEYFG